LSEAEAWYENERKGLGEALQSEVRRAEILIAALSSTWPLGSRGQRYVLRRFPYAIWYVRDAERITIVAVAHHKRDPSHFVDR
jgi:toxin ParE1/3/4